MSEHDHDVDKDELLADEPDLLRGLLRAGEERTAETVSIEIARKGTVYFSFRVRALSEDDYEACREKATVYKSARKLGGISVPERTNTSKYRSLLIYTATVEEDRKVLWDNKEAQKHFGVLNGWQLIDKVLMAGEKEAVVDKIDEISGFDVDLEETAKN